MAFIPKDAKWYLADIVQELQIESEQTSLVYINLTLIRADSPDEAYERSLEVGTETEHVYQNTDGQTVRVIFRGLRNLYVIYEELEHGREILYERLEGVTEAEISKLIRSKADLSVFTPAST